MKILSLSDLHLMDTQPLARKDDFVRETQWKKLIWVKRFVKEIGIEHVIHAGDLFDFWKPSPWLISKAIQHLPKQFYTVYGNHDLQRHSLDRVENTGVFTLQQAKAIHVLPFGHYGQQLPETFTMLFDGVRIAVLHVGVMKKLPPYLNGYTPSDLLSKYPEVDVFMTGHFHTSFAYEEDGRWVINQGGIFRTRADDINRIPFVYVYDTNENTVQKYPVPIEEGVVSRVHIEEKEEKLERIQAFVQELQKGIDVTLNFMHNLQRFLEVNEIDENVKQIIEEVYDE